MKTEDVQQEDLGRRGRILLLEKVRMELVPSRPRTCEDMAAVFFPYQFDRRWDALFRLLGVRDDQGVEITDDGRLIAAYGRFRVSTTVDNVAGAEVTGPHRWYTAVGVRLARTDDGITFGTNHYKGLWIHFKRRVPRVIGFRDHSLLWVSVADPEGLAATLDPNSEPAAERA